MSETLYLDNAATSHPKPEAVYLAVDRYLRSGGSIGRGSHSQTMNADRLIFETREKLAELFDVDDSENFIFTSNATHAINLALFGLLQPGDRVVTSMLEHNAVIRPLRELQDRAVEVVKVAADRRTSQIDIEQLKQACLDKPTRLLIVTQCSNVSGAVQHLEGLGAWCRQQGILFMVDGSQLAGTMPLSLVELQADLYAAPGHKGLLGPQGTGFLYCAEGIDPRPLIYGGTGNNSDSDRQPQHRPERYESGTHNLPALAGLNAALEFLLETGLATVRARELEHIERLYNGLAGIAGIELYGPAEPSERGAVISFNVADRDPAEIGFLLNQQGIAVRIGLHCAADAHRTIGTFPRGTVRISPGFFTTPGELDHFFAALRAIL